MKPHPRNLCGGNYRDWLEVMLLPECNGRCAWCIERGGWHPKERVGWTVLRDQIVRIGKHYVHLLGGEPFLYANLKELTVDLVAAQCHVYITTNGSRLQGCDFLRRFAGINVSVHHYDLCRNADIMGIMLAESHLSYAAGTAQRLRLNCNLIRNQIDGSDDILAYVAWAKRLGVDSVRFAELKQDHGAFVDAHTVFPEHPLPKDPFTSGCSQDIEIDGMPVNVRLMCGLQTPHRSPPKCPEQMGKAVLYYDGILYDGWQRQQEASVDQTLRERIHAIRQKVKEGKLTQEQAWEEIDKETLWAEREEKFSRASTPTSHDCRY